MSAPINAIVERIREHITALFPDRFATEGTIIFRDITGRNSYGAPIYSETAIPIKFYMRVYRVRGLSPTTVGEVPERNFIITLPHYTSFPRAPNENDLLVVGGEKYRFVAIVPYVAAGQTVAYSGLCRMYKEGS